MVVGLGTGSTVAFAIKALAERCRLGLNVRTVATSLRTEVLARESGIDVVDFSRLATVDLCIDGVDEIDPMFRAIKGAGGAMLREKIVARAATRNIAIADGSKAVSRLGLATVPIEMLPFARGYINIEVEKLGGKPVLRIGQNGQPYLTDQGNEVLDCAFGVLDTPGDMADRLSNIAGVLGHGLFIDEIDALYIGIGEHVERREKGGSRTISDRPRWWL